LKINDRKYENLFPHERRIVNNEFFQHKKVNERLKAAVKESVLRRRREWFERIGGFAGLEKTAKQMREKGMTIEKLEKMSNSELADWMEKNNIEN